MSYDTGIDILWDISFRFQNTVYLAGSGLIALNLSSGEIDTLPHVGTDVFSIVKTNNVEFAIMVSQMVDGHVYTKDYMDQDWKRLDHLGTNNVDLSLVLMTKII